MTLNRSTVEQRQTKLRYLRYLYTLVVIELIFAVAWASFCLYFWDALGAGVVRWWEFGVVAGCLVGLLLLICLLFSFPQRFPLNWIIYIVFTLSLAHLLAFLACLDPQLLAYFAIWCLTAITLGFFAYALVTTNYLQTIESIVMVFGTAAIVLFVFLVLTEISEFLLVLIYLAASLFGVYLSISVRLAVRSLVHESEEDEPVSGAVKIWVEGLLTFCRWGELFGQAMLGK